MVIGLWEGGYLDDMILVVVVGQCYLFFDIYNFKIILFMMLGRCEVDVLIL